MGQILVGIDVGTSKVSTIIGRVGNNGQLEVLGKGVDYCYGIKRGMIVDIDSTAMSICNSVEQAGEMANVQVNSAYVNVSGIGVDIFENRFSIDLDGKNIEVTKRDIEKLQILTRAVKISPETQIIDIIPRQYVLDNNGGIFDPIGMVGSRLEMETDIVTGSNMFIQNLKKSFEKANLSVSGLVIEALSAGEIMLYDEEKKNGTLLLDVGGSITNITVYKNNNLIFFGAVNLGGEHITNDISLALNIPYTEAERIKRKYDLELGAFKDTDEEISVIDINDNEKSIKLSEVVEIIEARTREIFSMGKGYLLDQGMSSNYVMNVVLTGRGISYIDGVKEMASDIFGVDSRIVSIKQVGINQAEYFVAAGIIKYVTENIEGSSCEVKYYKEQSSKTTFFTRFLKMFNSLFKFT